MKSLALFYGTACIIILLLHYANLFIFIIVYNKCCLNLTSEKMCALSLRGTSHRLAAELAHSKVRVGLTG